MKKIEIKNAEAFNKSFCIFNFERNYKNIPPEASIL